MRPQLLLLAVGILATAGCSAGDTRAAGLAGAECRSAVHDHLQLPDTDTGLNAEFTVTEDTDGRHVEGNWHHPELGNGTFSCDVVPDASDQLRGLRVTALTVGSAP